MLGSLKNCYYIVLYYLDYSRNFHLHYIVKSSVLHVKQLLIGQHTENTKVYIYDMPKVKSSHSCYLLTDL